MSQTEQVKFVYRRFRTIGLRRGDFSARVNRRRYRDRDGREQVEYGDVSIVVWSETWPIRFDLARAGFDVTFYFSSEKIYPNGTVTVARGEQGRVLAYDLDRSECVCSENQVGVCAKCSAYLTITTEIPF